MNRIDKLGWPKPLPLAALNVRRSYLLPAARQSSTCTVTAAAQRAKSEPISNRKCAINASLNILTTGVLQNPNRKWIAISRTANCAQKRESNER
jgi:hypothetical protein